jgi:hypothetical protein
VPKDLKFPGKKATVTVTVRYDTLGLYGRVQASRTVVIESE